MITKAKGGKIDSQEDFPSSREKKGKLKFFLFCFNGKMFFTQTRKCNLCFAFPLKFFPVFFSFSFWTFSLRNAIRKLNCLCTLTFSSFNYKSRLLNIRCSHMVANNNPFDSSFTNNLGLDVERN